MEWFTLSLLAMFFYGIQGFLFKVAAEKKMNSAVLMTNFMIFGSLIAFILWMARGAEVFNLRTVIFFGVMNTIFWQLGNIARLEGLKKIPAIVGMPIYRTHNTLSVLIAVIFLKEQLTLMQWSGVFVSLLVVLILAHENNSNRKTIASRGMALLITSAILSSVASIIVKLAAPFVDYLLFAFVSYVWAGIVSFSYHRFADRQKGFRFTHAELKMSMLMAIANVSGFYLLLSALSTGSASVIFPAWGLA